MKILIYDIETLKVMYLLCVYDPVENKMYDFALTEDRNDMDAMFKFFETHADYYWIGFNNLHFDSQVVEYTIRNQEYWFNKSNEELLELIYQKSQDTIDDGNYNVYPTYPEYSLTLKQIDLFTIWHFNNENRRTSLKAVEFAIDFENIEEMPYPHSISYLTPAQIQEVIDYCHNDVMATYAFWKITLGETEMEFYKGKNKIADRLIMQDEFGLKCLNWDDVKIGAEWNKMDYIALTKKDEHKLKPEKVNHYFGKKFKQFFPKTVSFQTPQLKEFVRKFGETFALNKKQEFRYKFNDELTATIAKGGIHSNEGARIIIPADDEIYYQIDIGSQYPNAIRKYKVEPKHLPGWNSLIVKKIERRLNYKSLWKKTKDPKFASLQEMGKLSLNGGAYGRLNTKGDWQEDPCCMMQVTIGGQLEILMVVEALILKGFRVISLNTDGFDVIIKKEREKEFRDILTNYEKIIGNDVLGQFEYTQFDWIVQTSVNHYLARKTEDGKPKMKGDFDTEKEIHKDKSKRIVPLALKEYFYNGTPVEETIKNHTNIYDFCIRQRANKYFHYEGVIKNYGKESRSVYNKLIRYYVSEKGEKIYKIKNPDCPTNAAEASQVEAGEWLCTVCNYLPKDTNPKEAGIDYAFYIEQANKIINRVQGNKPPKKVAPGQLTLF